MQRRLPDDQRAGWGGSTLALVAMLALALAGAARADPQSDYILNCRGCHGPDGNGIAGAAPPFRGEVGKFLWVPGGREYLIRVPGTSQSELSNARVAALLTWIVCAYSPNEVPADFTPFTAEEVARFRRPPLAEVERTRRALVEAIAAHPAGPAAPPLTPGAPLREP